MHHDLVDVLIIEDESELARLHAELVQNTRDCGWQAWRPPSPDAAAASRHAAAAGAAG